MYFSPGGKVASHAEAGMLSVLEGIGNNHENKEGDEGRMWALCLDYFLHIMEERG